MGGVREQWYKEGLCKRLENKRPPFIPQHEMRDDMFIFSDLPKDEDKRGFPDLKIEDIIEDKDLFDKIHCALFNLMLQTNWKSDVLNIKWGRSRFFENAAVVFIVVLGDGSSYYLSDTRLSRSHYNTIHLPRFEVIADLRLHTEYPSGPCLLGTGFKKTWHIWSIENYQQDYTEHGAVALGKMKEPWKKRNKNNLRNMKLI